MSEEYVSVKIPKKLYEKIKQQVSQSKEFSSVEEYIKFVLETALEEMEEEVYTPEEEEKIKERLKALGYL